MIFAMGPNVALILLLLGTHTVNTVDAKNRDHWISVYNHWEIEELKVYNVNYDPARLTIIPPGGSAGFWVERDYDAGTVCTLLIVHTIYDM